MDKLRDSTNKEKADNQLKICFCGNKGAGESCDDSCKVVEKGDN